MEPPCKHGVLQRIILYKLYRKLIANRIPFNSRAAYPQKDRIQMISQEFIRRFKNTSRELPKFHIEEIVREFCQDLQRGGFNNKFISTCLESASKGYMKMVRLELEGTQPVNRPAQFGAKGRRVKKILAKSSWFKRKKQGQNQSDHNGQSKPQASHSQE